MRVYKRINDIYEVELPDCKRYFQFLGSDSSLLGGNVIAIFRDRHDKSASPEVNDIIKGPVEYYSHTNINYGVELGLWKKYGNAPACNDLSRIYFRNYVDERNIWHIWRANEKLLSFAKVPYKFRKAYITYLFPPHCVCHKFMYGRFLGEDVLSSFTKR